MPVKKSTGPSKVNQDQTPDGFPPRNSDHTPMMTQFLAIKAKHPDCLIFYRMGDFYELFYRDAEIAARTLDITLTSRGKSDDDDIPMAGVPFHSYTSYLAGLIEAGHKVAICEQIETPDEAKEKRGSGALVKRQVVRVVTQGTLTEDNLLTAGEHNFLAAICLINGEVGLAWADLSTGQTGVKQIEIGHILDECDRLQINEVVIDRHLADEYPPLMDQLSSRGITLSQVDSHHFSHRQGKDKLQSLFNLSTLDSIGDLNRPHLSALAGLYEYVDQTQVGQLPRLNRPRLIRSDQFMRIDRSTRQNLELFQTIKGKKSGSLLAKIDFTATSFGARQLADDLRDPLIDKTAIDHRLNSSGFLHDNNILSDKIMTSLKSCPDMERSLARLSVDRAGPRDLARIRDGLIGARRLADELSPLADLPVLLSDCRDNLRFPNAVTAVHDTLAAGLKSDLPMLARDGDFIADGFHTQLDELRNIKFESRRKIAALQAKYREITQIDSLKIKNNKVLGYFVEVTSKHADTMMTFGEEDQHAEYKDFFHHRQTLANSTRFTTNDLVELERKLTGADDRALALELDLYDQLKDDILSVEDAISTIARALARVDVINGHAIAANHHQLTRPQITTGRAFDIEQARHLIVEQAMENSDQRFVPNDCDLSDGQRFQLITGPNMSGKSTYLRQNAHLILMAQIGGFVPAESATIGIVDRLFSRIGASDDLAEGRSTFMVEMVETAVILNQASDHSFVILDEIGRGTATFDGLSIAWAAIEYLHDQVDCRTLFATHYHELTALADRLDQLVCMTIKTKQWQGDIVFLHEVVPGMADGSYGIHVAKIAGLPEAVTTRAHQILTALEEREAANDADINIDDLPLFDTTQVKNAPAAADHKHPLAKKLSNVDPDHCTPATALELLYDLKELSEESPE